MEFRILGSLTVTSDSADLTPTAPKIRQVLALLILRNNQLVQTDSLIDELWGEDPPQSALSTLQTYIYKLRKLFAGDRSSGADVLITKPAGYIARIQPESIDAWCFERMAARGRELMDAGSSADSAETLAQALRLWHGPALADVATGSLLSAYVMRLEELRLTTLELRCEAELQLGRHRELISELKALAAAHPFHEGFHAKLMLALLRTGRRGEGLEVYQRIRQVLVDELGVEPSGQLKRLQQSLLAPEKVPVAPRVPAPRPASVVSVPAQLPPDTADFVGRQAELDCLTRRLLPGDGAGGTALPVTLITGMPGVGKTALATRAGHLVKNHFAGGQFFADLHGSGQSPADPADVLRGFLQSAGFPPTMIPGGLEERSKLFRTWTASHRALVVLDDAASVAQVQPLLPSSVECAVIVCSRTALSQLAGSQLIELGTLSPDEGVRMLSSIVGQTRIDREPEAAAEIIQMCGRLPLAIRSVGARLVTMWAVPLHRVVQQLSGAWAKWSELTHADYDVGASFERSYRLLHATEQSAFRVLSLLRENDFTAPRAADLLGRSLESTEELLGRLVETRLLQMVGCRPTGEVCYAFHELARLYAKARLAETLDEDPGPEWLAGQAILGAEEGGVMPGPPPTVAAVGGESRATPGEHRMAQPANGRRPNPLSSVPQGPGGGPRLAAQASVTSPPAVPSAEEGQSDRRPATPPRPRSRPPPGLPFAQHRDTCAFAPSPDSPR